MQRPMAVVVDGHMRVGFKGGNASQDDQSEQVRTVATMMAHSILFRIKLLILYLESTGGDIPIS